MEIYHSIIFIHLKLTIRKFPKKIQPTKFAYFYQIQPINKKLFSPLCFPNYYDKISK